MVVPYKIFTFHEANTCVALTNACRRSVRALPSVVTSYNNNESENTVVKTVERELNTT
jgi:hypothetical protein